MLRCLPGNSRDAWLNVGLQLITNTSVLASQRYLFALDLVSAANIRSTDTDLLSYMLLRLRRDWQLTLETRHWPPQGSGCGSAPTCKGHKSV